MMKITIERLIEMYMMYSAMSSHIKTSARVTALWLSVSVDDLVRKLDIDLLDFCKALSSLWVLDSMCLLQSFFPHANMRSLSNRSCNKRSIHHAVILLKSTKFHDTGPCISARSFFYLRQRCITVHYFVSGWFSFSRHWLTCHHSDLSSQNDKSRNNPSILSSMSL